MRFAFIAGLVSSLHLYGCLCERQVPFGLERSVDESDKSLAPPRFEERPAQLEIGELALDLRGAAILGALHIDFNGDAKEDLIWLQRRAETASLIALSASAADLNEHKTIATFDVPACRIEKTVLRALSKESALAWIQVDCVHGSRQEFVVFRLGDRPSTIEHLTAFPLHDSNLRPDYAFSARDLDADGFEDIELQIQLSTSDGDA